ncbi:hypothetical protein B0T18DRAFT_25475 [Schizothecium vesticola]|uniref:Uncharacterized protein n=1 Tax=Schizothecium vesticola TaxID=314040 RepID=A0AA40FA15_9PEZI|nr:hypothetical protein B0T18DRAFT_25475 [Schizothecium vesticola]
MAQACAALSKLLLDVPYKSGTSRALHGSLGLDLHVESAGPQIFGENTIYHRRSQHPGNMFSSRNRTALPEDGCNQAGHHLQTHRIEQKEASPMGVVSICNPGHPRMRTTMTPLPLHIAMLLVWVAIWDGVNIILHRTMGKDKKTNDGHAKSSRSSRPPRGPASQAHGHGHPNYDAGHGHPNYDDGYGHQNYDEGHGNAGGLRGNPQHDPFFHVPSQPSTTPRSRPANQEFDSPHGGGELGHAPSASLSSIGSGSTNSQSLYYPSTTTQSQVNLDAESSDLAGQMAHITLDPSYSQQQQQHWGGPLRSPQLPWARRPGTPQVPKPIRPLRTRTTHQRTHQRLG